MGDADANPFADESTATEVMDAPVFTDPLAYLDCTLHDPVGFGYHTIYVGRAERVETRHPDADPLTFFQGDWGTVSPDDTDDA